MLIMDVLYLMLIRFGLGIMFGVGGETIICPGVKIGDSVTI